MQSKKDTYNLSFTTALDPSVCSQVDLPHLAAALELRETPQLGRGLGVAGPLSRQHLQRLCPSAASETGRDGPYGPLRERTPRSFKLRNSGIEWYRYLYHIIIIISP